MRRTRIVQCLSLMNILCLGFIAVIAAAVSVTAYASKAEEQDGHGEEGVIQDLAWMANLLEEVSGSDMALTAMKIGMIKLAKGEEPSDVVQMVLNSGSSRADTGMAALSSLTRLAVSVQQQSGGEALVVVRLESHSLEEMERYSEWFQHLDARLLALGIQSDWRLNLQADMKEGLHADEFWDRLEEAGAHRTESIHAYQDLRSASMTYTVPRLHRKITAAGQEIHLQAAVHHSTIGDGYRLTLGAPLITIEY